MTEDKDKEAFERWAVGHGMEYVGRFVTKESAAAWKAWQAARDYYTKKADYLNTEELEKINRSMR